jgi:hypothetical protein
LWIVLPTILYAYLTERLAPTLVLIGIGLGVRFVQRRPGISPRLRAFVPFVQPAIVFLMLGGSAVLLAGLIVAFIALLAQRSPIARALVPWWRLQQHIAPATRRLLSFAVPSALGVVLARANGGAARATLLTMGVGTLISFLLLFTPPITPAASAARARSPVT